MTVINYYEELGIDSTASLDEIKKSIRSNRRRYRSLTGSPNIDQRSMAERKMALLAEAEKIFDSEESRKKYDEEIKQSDESSTTESEQSETSYEENNSESEFVNRSRSAYSVGNLNLAAQYAQEATKVDRNNLEAWKLRATIAQERKQFDEAEMACTEAAYIKSDDSEIMGLMGDVHFAQNKYDLSIKDYERAFQLSKNYYWQVQKAFALWKSGHTRKAAQLFESLVEYFSDIDSKTTILKFAAAAYEELNMESKNRELLHRIIGLEPTLENKLAYARFLRDQEAVGYAEELLKEYDKNNSVQNYYVESLISDFISRNSNTDSLKIDSKEKAQNASDLLKKIQSVNLTSKSALNRVSELKKLNTYANQRHLQKVGCGVVIWILLLYFIVQWIAGVILGDGLGKVAGIVAVLGYISYFVYPKGWLVTKRGG